MKTRTEHRFILDTNHVQDKIHFMFFFILQSVDLYQIPTKCESGCVCADGLYENLDGRCVPAEDCPCEYGGLAYGRGEQIQTECEIW